RGLEVGGTDDRGIQLLPVPGREAPELAGGDLDVLRLHSVAHIERSQSVVVELRRVEPDAHGVLRTEELEVAHPRGSTHRVLHVRGNEVRYVLAAHAVVGGDQADDQQEVPGGLRDFQAQLLYFLRQPRERELQFVLHLHLRDVGISALREVERDGDAAVLVALGGHVEQVVEAAHLLLDDLYYRVLDRLGGGAGGGAGDRHRRRGERGKLRHRQFQDGERPRHHHDDGDDPGEDRSVDEETSHAT